MEPKRSKAAEKAWAAIEELGNAQRLTEKARREGEKERREGEKALREAQKKTEKGFQKLQESQQKTEKSLRESQEKTEKSLRESQEKTEKSLRESQEKTEKSLRESQEKTEKSLRESQEKTEKALRELKKSLKESNRELTKNLNEANGNFNNKWGKFLENLVKGDLVKLLSERNIKVDRIQPRLIICGPTGREIGDFDLVAINGNEIVAIEVKTTLTKEKVEKFIGRLKMFKKYFPEYADKVIYGGVAFLCEPEDEEARGAAEYAEENGLFVIFSPGGSSNVTTMSNSKDFKPKSF